MTLFLQMEPWVPVEVIPGEQLPDLPRLVLRGLALIVGPYSSGVEHEHHHVQTLGSGSWHAPEYDEFRFDPVDRSLRSVWLHVSERAPEGSERVAEWLNAERRVGGLHLAGEVPSRLDISALREMDREHDVLASFAAPSAAPALVAPLRLAIAQDVELLFQDHVACGWMLRHPGRYLSRDWAPPSSQRPDTSLASLLCDYFSLVAEEQMERMEDGDPALRSDLLDLRARVAQRGDLPASGVLLSAIDDVLERFYSGD